MSESRNPTELLRAWQGGDEAALEQLTSRIYDEMRLIAGRLMRSESSGHTLQATALVNEAFTRLLDARVDFQGRQHFLALAARTMRRVLVDHARARQRVKRGDGRLRVTLDEQRLEDVDALDVIELDDALGKLADFDGKLARTVELMYFGGLSPEEAAAALGVSRSALYADLKFARAWLRTAMS